MSMVNDKMRKILKLLKKSKKIALFSHISPDPDTIGSTMALFYALKSLKKDVYLFFKSFEADRRNYISEIPLPISYRHITLSHEKQNTPKKQKTTHLKSKR